MNTLSNRAVSVVLTFVPALIRSCTPLIVNGLAVEARTVQGPVPVLAYSQ